MKTFIWCNDGDYAIFMANAENEENARQLVIQKINDAHELHIKHCEKQHNDSMAFAKSSLDLFNMWITMAMIQKKNDLNYVSQNCHKIVEMGIADIIEHSNE
jgi:hypothetical protein